MPSRSARVQTPNACATTSAAGEPVRAPGAGYPAGLLHCVLHLLLQRHGLLRVSLCVQAKQQLAFASCGAVVRRHRTPAPARPRAPRPVQHPCLRAELASPPPSLVQGALQDAPAGGLDCQPVDLPGPAPWRPAPVQRAQGRCVDRIAGTCLAWNSTCWWEVSLEDSKRSRTECPRACTLCLQAPPACSSAMPTTLATRPPPNGGCTTARLPLSRRDELRFPWPEAGWAARAVWVAAHSCATQCDVVTPA